MHRSYIHVAVDVEMLEALDAMAKEDHTTRSAVVRDILEENLIGMGLLEDDIDYSDSQDDEWTADRLNG